MQRSLRECAQALGITPPTAAAGRKLLKNADMLDPHFSPHDPVAGRRALKPDTLDSLHANQGTPPPVSAPAPATFLPSSRTVKEGEVSHMNPDEARRVLAGLARGGAGSDAAQIAALREVLKEGADTGSHLGPGMPLTKDERLHRASLIMQAVGREDAPEVWQRAFHETVDATTPLPPVPIIDDIPNSALPSIETAAPGASASLETQVKVQTEVPPAV